MQKGNKQNQVNNAFGIYFLNAFLLALKYNSGHILTLYS